MGSHETDYLGQGGMIGTNFSGYHVLAKIGGGNTGIVYKARDARSGLTVALKILADDFLVSTEKKARFLRETRATGILSHPAIAKLYTAGEFQGHNYLAMEYVDGESFSQLIHAQPDGLALRDFFSLMLPILEGTAFAHQRNIAHRDLKPDNLKRTSKGQPKILDFGLVKFLDVQASSGEESFQTFAGMVVGSAGYMSPEQASGNVIDERTDVFSLGIIMYELLAGKNPFQAKSPFSTIEKILTATPISLELLRPDIPLPLCNVILKCLTKNQNGRYPNGGSLLQALQSVRS